jgi:formyltetrahydrofolate deformylase
MSTKDPRPKDKTVATTHDESVIRLLVMCADRPGIVSTISSFLYNHGANIIDLDQHSTDPEGGMFFMRLEFALPHRDLPRSVLERSFQEAVAKRYDMQWRISYANDYKRTAILVSKYDHAMLDVLWRWSRDELPTDVAMVVSNHPDLQQAVEQFEVPYHHVPVEKGAKDEAEEQILELFDDDIDLVILARYMQILSGDFVDRFPNSIINIHHSFLPAFVGAAPYKQAKKRGVKLIGATAHYATEELDAGPIIEQDVVRVTHRHSVRDLKELGRTIERDVLARAVKWHLEDRIIVHGNKTVVFR